MLNKKLFEMFSMQSELNTYICGDRWHEDITADGNVVDWTRCVRFELVEAVDQSFQWKHWKNNAVIKQYAVVDEHNLKIELVDTYHFLMSEMIKLGLDKVVNEKLSNNQLSNKFFERKTYESGIALIDEIENLEYKVFTYEKADCCLKNEILYEIFKDFWLLSSKVLDFSEFYGIYILKNTLNLFRQKNGYKNGTYIKKWGTEEIEDNQFLEKYTKNGNNIEFEEIYNYLENEYKTLNKL